MPKPCIISCLTTRNVGVSEVFADGIPVDADVMRWSAAMGSPQCGITWLSVIEVGLQRDSFGFTLIVFLLTYVAESLVTNVLLLLGFLSLGEGRDGGTEDLRADDEPGCCRFGVGRG